MNKWVFILLLCLMPLSSVMANDGKDSSLVLDLRRLGLDFSKTQVRNAEYYTTSPVTALSTSNQEYIKGMLDVILEYNKNKFKWDNGILLEYGKTTLKPSNAPPASDESADKILLSSNLSYAMWDFYGLKIGPTLREAYQTQFSGTAGNPRQNVIRSSLGVSLFDHNIVKNLYIVGIYEYDMTYSNQKDSKLGAELGINLEYTVRKGVKLSADGYYREYFDYTEYIPNDLERDLSAVLRLDTTMWGNFTMGPYVKYRLAKARYTSVYGSNFMFGISFSYINKFLLK